MSRLDDADRAALERAAALAIVYAAAAAAVLGAALVLGAAFRIFRMAAGL